MNMGVSWEIFYLELEFTNLASLVDGHFEILQTIASTYYDQQKGLKRIDL
jgi:hypothetical protein